MGEENADLWYPEPKAPDISELLKQARGVMSGAAMTSAVAGAGICAPPAAGLVRNMMRLLVRACEEYQAAIEYHSRAVTAGSPVGLMHASSHWEGCIEALHRCITIAEGFRRNLGKWAPDDDLMRVDKSAQIRESDWSSIRCMRHAIQHMDEELLNTPRPEDDARGQGYFVYCGADAIVFRGCEVRYADLARLLAHLLNLAIWMKMQNPPPGHPLADPTREIEINHVGSEHFRKPFGT